MGFVAATLWVFAVHFSITWKKLLCQGACVEAFSPGQHLRRSAAAGGSLGSQSCDPTDRSDQVLVKHRVLYVLAKHQDTEKTASQRETKGGFKLSWRLTNSPGEHSTDLPRTSPDYTPKIVKLWAPAARSDFCPKAGVGTEADQTIWSKTEWTENLHFVEIVNISKDFFDAEYGVSFDVSCC